MANSPAASTLSPDWFPGVTGLEPPSPAGRPSELVTDKRGQDPAGDGFRRATFSSLGAEVDLLFHWDGVAHGCDVTADDKWWKRLSLRDKYENIKVRIQMCDDFKAAAAAGCQESSLQPSL